MKRSTKRSLYLQILLFISSGVWTMFKDKKMELLMFATSHIYRESGDGSKNNDSTTTTGGTDNGDDDNCIVDLFSALLEGTRTRRYHTWGLTHTCGIPGA